MFKKKELKQKCFFFSAVGRYATVTIDQPSQVINENGNAVFQCSVDTNIASNLYELKWSRGSQVGY